MARSGVEVRCNLCACLPPLRLRRPSPTSGDGAAGRRRRAARRGLPRAGPLPLPPRPPPLPPLRHLRHAQPALPLLLLPLRLLIPVAESLRRRLVAGRLGRCPLRPPRRVRVRVRAVLRLPAAPPRLHRAPRPIP